MRRLIFLLLALISFTFFSCDKEEEEKVCDVKKVTIDTKTEDHNFYKYEHGVVVDTVDDKKRTRNKGSLESRAEETRNLLSGRYGKSGKEAYRVVVDNDSTLWYKLRDHVKKAKEHIGGDVLKVKDCN